MSRVMLNYKCDQCGEEFQKPCYLAGDKIEYDKVRQQLPTPFSENFAATACFSQMECPKCQVLRQVPILQLGVLLPG